MAQRDEATSLNDSTSEWQGKIHTQACLTLSPQLPKKPEKLGPLAFRGIPTVDVTASRAWDILGASLGLATSN